MLTDNGQPHVPNGIFAAGCSWLNNPLERHFLPAFSIKEASTRKPAPVYLAQKAALWRFKIALMAISSATCIILVSDPPIHRIC